MPRQRFSSKPYGLIAGLMALALGSIGSAQAGTAIGESIWDQNNATDRALQLVPRGAVVTSTDCQSVEVGTGNVRYICRVTYSDPPAANQAPTR